MFIHTVSPPVSNGQVCTSLNSQQLLLICLRVGRIRNTAKNEMNRRKKGYILTAGGDLQMEHWRSRAALLWAGTGSRSHPGSQPGTCNKTQGSQLLRNKSLWTTRPRPRAVALLSGSQFPLVADRAAFGLQPLSLAGLGAVPASFM